MVTGTHSNYQKLVCWGSVENFEFANFSVIFVVQTYLLKQSGDQGRVPYFVPLLIVPRRSNNTRIQVMCPGKPHDAPPTLGLNSSEFRTFYGLYPLKLNIISNLSTVIWFSTWRKFRAYYPREDVEDCLIIKILLTIQTFCDVYFLQHSVSVGMIFGVSNIMFFQMQVNWIHPKLHYPWDYTEF